MNQHIHLVCVDQLDQFVHKSTSACEVVEEDFILEAPGVIRPKGVEGVDSLNWLPLLTAAGTF